MNLFGIASAPGPRMPYPGCGPMATRTSAWLKDLVDRMAFPPGVSVRVIDPRSDYDDCTVEMTVMVRPVDGSEGQIPVKSATRLSTGILELDDGRCEYVRHCLFRLWMQFSEHEWHEWFRVDGLLVTDPHPGARQ